MQTPKAKAGSLEVPLRKSPITPRTAQKFKTSDSDSDPISSPHAAASRTPKNQSPKTTDRKSPRSSASEKKRPTRVPELESQLAQLQDELKKSKDALNSNDSAKKQAEKEAEETKKQLLAMSAKLEESQKELLELSASDDDRVQELRKISHDRDKAWQSELEAVQKQHTIDSSALASAMNEIQKLKDQLEMVSESEAALGKKAETAYGEIGSLRGELVETLSFVEKLKLELSDCKESESQALEEVKKTETILKTANRSIEVLRSDAIKATEAYDSLSLELEQSKARVLTLEGLVNKFQSDLDVSRTCIGTNVETEQLRSEVGQLKSALDAAERKYHEEYIHSTLQIRSAYEQVELTKSEASKKEAVVEEELKWAKACMEQLQANLTDKEAHLQSVLDQNKILSSKNEVNISIERESDLEIQLKKTEADMAEVKASLQDKENELQSLRDENEMRKIEIKSENERKVNAEQEALMKLNHATEEADRSSRRAMRATEQLDSAQAANSELETELRRLKVQADQWRKAAEAAANMLSNGNNGKFVERTSSLASNFPLGSPYSEDFEDDDSPKKKNGNVLKKIGVLWKKGQK